MSATVAVVEPSGILDSTKAEEFHRSIEEILATETEFILIDLKNITFIDSSGLGTLVVVLKKVKASHRNMYICSVNDQVRMLFDLTSMHQVFDVVSDRAAFEAIIREQGKID